MKASEMIAALEQVMGRNNNRDGFYTTVELALEADLTVDTIRKRLNAARMAGRLESKKVKEPGLGGVREFTCYRILPG